MTEEYRIVERYSGFFSHSYFILQKRSRLKLWGWTIYDYWFDFAGHELQKYPPDDWSRFNIVDRIDLKP